MDLSAPVNADPAYDIEELMSTFGQLGHGLALLMIQTPVGAVNVAGGMQGAEGLEVPDAPAAPAAVEQEVRTSD